MDLIFVDLGKKSLDLLCIITIESLPLRGGRFVKNPFPVFFYMQDCIVKKTAVRKGINIAFVLHTAGFYCYHSCLIAKLHIGSQFTGTPVINRNGSISRKVGCFRRQYNIRLKQLSAYISLGYVCGCSYSRR